MARAFKRRNSRTHVPKILLTFSLVGAQAFADSPSDKLHVSDPSSLVGAASAARGGATVASQVTHDSLMQNPASAAFGSAYAVSGGYLGTGNGLFASIVDTKSGPIGGGIYYLKRDLRNLAATQPEVTNYNHTEELAGLSLMGKVRPNIGLGATVRYSYRRSYDDRIKNAAGWNFDVGAQYLASSQVIVGLLAQDIVQNEKSMFPERMGVGISYLPMMGLNLSTQVFKTQKTSTASILQLPNPNAGVEYAFGADYSATGSVNIRAGYHENPTWFDRKMSLGAAYLSKEFSVDYAFQWKAGHFSQNTNTVTLTGYF